MKWSDEEVADEPAKVATVTSIVPAAWDGAMAVREVAELTVKSAASTPPKKTSVAPVKLVPVRLTVVPPAVLPLEVLRPVTVGTEARV